MKAPPRKKLYHLSGEGQVNGDGSHRQAILKSCLPGMSVDLVREPNNPYDPNAIAAHVNGMCIGYIAREDAEALVGHMELGRVFKAQINELRGGMRDFPNFGCVLCVVDEALPFLSPKPLEPTQVFYRGLGYSQSGNSSGPRNSQGLIGRFLTGLMSAIKR
ncbi:HIRAN domain-containing protein [Novosphingobium sp.]|uniref:HIRAN domain-containing protein n=1 Tax=Novosphingobium sp. TaxID=1874826 RepID=UPI00341EE847